MVEPVEARPDSANDVAGFFGLDGLISDGLVIQRDAPFPIYTSVPVRVEFLGREYASAKRIPLPRAHAERSKVEFSLPYRVLLDPQPAGGPYQLTISGDDHAMTIRDVYVGDVWLCAGQSNMELQMQRLRDTYPEEWELADYPPIHNFRLPQDFDFSGPRATISGGKWYIASRKTLADISGVGWFFAKEMYDAHEVPIGMVNSAWGGTPIQSWLSRQALECCPDLIAEGDAFADQSALAATARVNQRELDAWYGAIAAQDRGLAEGWQSGGWAKSDGVAHLPGGFADFAPGFNGVLWFTREFTVTEPDALNRVWLGTIVDADTVYINGVEIGKTEYRYPPRKYRIPSGLVKPGLNTITIRVVVNDGEGEITEDKPFRVFRQRRSVELVETTAEYQSSAIELSGDWQYRIGFQCEPCPEQFFGQRIPMGNYNAMIAPVLKYPFRGVLWYQGEANTDDGYEYIKYLLALIDSWRAENGNDELPFIVVQLPLFGPETDNDPSSHWAALRDAQAGAVIRGHVGIADTLEFGEANDLHPLDKKGVAHRVFATAQRVVFRARNTAPGPQVSDVELGALGEVTITFANSGAERGGGLNCRHGERPVLSVVRGDGSTVSISGTFSRPDGITLNIAEIPDARQILYAWADNPKHRDIYNSDGWPALPFSVQLPKVLPGLPAHIGYGPLGVGAFSAVWDTLEPEETKQNQNTNR